MQICAEYRKRGSHFEILVKVVSEEDLIDLEINSH